MRKESWDRIYEGEWIFICLNNCGGYLIEFSFNVDHDPSRNIMDFYDRSSDAHVSARCNDCGGILKWYGCIPHLTVSKSLSTLLQGQHFMAATVMIAAVVENYISNLLFASLVDEGVSVLRANNVADSKLARRDAINLIQDLTDWPIRDISFPVRNMVAHGRRLSQQPLEFVDDLQAQVRDIRKWFERLSKGFQINYFKPNEKDRWLLSMQHWITWLEKIIQETTRVSLGNEA